MNTPRRYEDPARTTPVGMARYATEFMEAALAADEKMGAKPEHEFVAPVPVMFLVGQAVELVLKSYLLSQGVSLRQLRHDYGHELRRALRKAKELGLLSLVSLSEDELAGIELLDRLYSTKELQYIITGAKEFPVFGPLESAALKLIHGIGNSVGYPPRNLPHVA